MVKFNVSPIARALTALDKTSAKTSAIIATVFNQFIDACRVDGSIKRDAKGAKIVQKIVREAMDSLVAETLLEESSARNYSTGAARAFFHGVEWTASTHKDPALAVPNPNTGKTRTSGSVKTTDLKALIKTLVKSLEQARIMQSDKTAAGIVDLIIELDPAFKESTGE
jgi:site-specific recombinase XerD